ncbi:hypothetical protein B7R87_12710 [Streptomyces tsukubensis]|uniref:cholesterol 7-desaturase n=2 Tax=Streptomyces TaxID=1883 RepID=A0A7G3UG29_STRT9|nr:hypothetical protein B7R87_12710 [Streptomyces tsukubensis]QKM69286.1 (2Fe-2S)-binding protein [Streptomyces tsukubensis NRRL18488]
MKGTVALSSMKRQGPAHLPYPDGWFAVAFSRDIPPGRVLCQKFMGGEVVIYRTRSGLLRVTEPYCPHLGAHLGHGGTVEAENLVCPFHHLAFSPAGECVGAGRRVSPPRNARLTLLESREVDGIVIVWHHAQGAPPTWEVKSDAGRELMEPVHHLFTLTDHPQEVLENGVDLGHFPVVHGTTLEYTEEPVYDGPSVRSKAVFTPSNPRFGGLLSSVRVEAEATFHGLGWLSANVRLPALRLSIRIWVLPTPIDPHHTEVQLAVSMPRPRRRLRTLPPVGKVLLSKVFLSLALRGFCWDFRKDIDLWANKIYLERPRLTSCDRMVMPFRRWAKQFYSTTPQQGTPV